MGFVWYLLVWNAIYIYTDGYINIIHSDLKYNLLQKQKLR